MARVRCPAASGFRTTLNRETAVTKSTVSPVQIIVNADDLGISCQVNDAVFSLMAEGRVTSATMLAIGPLVAEAAARVRDFPMCSFGVHLNLTEFKPLTTDSALAPILNEAGEFNSNRIRKIHVGSRLREAIFHEWCAQIERLRTLGVELSHIDSHHHVHTIPSLFPVLKRVQKACGIRRVRLSMNIYGPRAKTSSLLLLKKRLWNFAVRNLHATITTAGMTDLDTFVETAGRMKAAAQTIEVMVHPGNPLFRDETELLRGRWLEQLPFEAHLISYRELAALPGRI
jgi:predicted glycoside hydrolase/deacetylase ChbG (UPF0249 family)